MNWKVARPERTLWSICGAIRWLTCSPRFPKSAGMKSKATPQELVETLAQFVYPPHTLEELRHAVDDWARWCEENHRRLFPMSWQGLALYTKHLCSAGELESVEWRVELISSAHEAMGWTDRNPTRNLSFKRAWELTQSRYLQIPIMWQACPLRSDEFWMLVAQIAGRSPLEVRDLLLLHLGYYGALSPRELVAIKFEDVAFGKEMRIRIQGKGQRTVAIIPEEELIDALERWCQKYVDEKTGPFLRSVGRSLSTTVPAQPMIEKDVRCRIQYWADRAGFRPTNRFTGLSLRNGYALFAMGSRIAPETVAFQAGLSNAAEAKRWMRSVWKRASGLPRLTKRTTGDEDTSSSH